MLETLGIHFCSPMLGLHAKRDCECGPGLRVGLCCQENEGSVSGLNCHDLNNGHLLLLLD